MRCWVSTIHDWKMEWSVKGPKLQYLSSDNREPRSVAARARVYFIQAQFLNGIPNVHKELDSRLERIWSRRFTRNNNNKRRRENIYYFRNANERVFSSFF